MRLRAIISSNSTSLKAAPGGGCPGTPPPGGKNAGLTWTPPGRTGATEWGGGNTPGTCLTGGGPVKTCGSGGAPGNPGGGNAIETATAPGGGA